MGTVIARTSLAVAVVVLLGTAADADRPSFSDLESRLQQVETQQARTIDSVCAQYEGAGQTYRPFVCDPRCDCVDDSTMAAFGAGDTCTRSGAGDYTATTTRGGTCLSTQFTCQDLILPASLDLYCGAPRGPFGRRSCEAENSWADCGGAAGGCADPNETCETLSLEPFPDNACMRVCGSDADCTPPPTTIRACTFSSLHTPCYQHSDCAQAFGETCHPVGVGSYVGVCAAACNVDADCPQFSLTCDNISGKLCNGVTWCPDGEECLFEPQGGYEYCGIACQTDADCDRTLGVTIQGAVHGDVTSPVTCNVSGQYDCAQGGCQINGADALTCVAGIEAAIGQSCTTSP